MWTRQSRFTKLCWDFAELKANGLANKEPNFRIDQHGDTKWKVFFVIAPDGLCYCLGERQP